MLRKGKTSCRAPSGTITMSCYLYVITHITAGPIPTGYHVCMPVMHKHPKWKRMRQVCL